MAEKKLRNIKYGQSSGHKLLGKNVVTNIALEERQNVVNIYPKCMTMAGDGNQQIAGDLEMLRKYNVDLEEKKYEDLVSNRTSDDELNRSESSIRETGSSNSSSSSQLSFILLELGSCFEEFNYGEKEENNVNLIDWDTELENKMPSDNPISTDNTIFDKSSERYLSQRNIPTVPQFAIKEIILNNSVEENESINVTQYFDENDVKKDGRKNAVQAEDNSTLPIYEMKDQLKKIREDFHSSNEKHAELQNPMSLVNYNINDIISFDAQVSEEYALQNDVSLAPHFPNNKGTISDSAEVKSVVETKKNYDNDVKLDSSRDSVQMQDSTATLSVKEGDIKELKEVFESLATCLLNCLETFHDRILKLEQGNNWNSKSLGNASNYKHNKTNIRGENTSETLKSHILENNFISNVKQGIDTVTCLSPVDNSENVHKVISNSESCACGFCDGSWLDIHSLRKNLSGVDQLKVAKISKKKITTLRISESEDLSNNLNVSSTTLKKSQSRSKSRKLDLPFSDLSSSVTKETGLVSDGAKDSISNCRIVHRSKSPNKEPYENYTSSSEKLNAIMKEKNKECFRRKNKESKHIKIYHKNDQLRRHEDDKEVIENEVDSKEMLFYAFLFLIPGLFCLLLFIFIFI